MLTSLAKTHCANNAIITFSCNHIISLITYYYETIIPFVKNLVPTNIVVKQTTRFNDGRTLVVYYKKSGTQCEVYSPCNAKDYDVADASKIKSTNFEVVDKVEGKLYKKASVGEVAKLIKRLVNQYL